MSFGFSLGDFITIIQLAIKVRKDFTGAPSQFRALSTEVRSLSIVLQDVDAFFSDAYLSENGITEQQIKHLCGIVDSCYSVLVNTQDTLSKYIELVSVEQGFGKAARRAWKRLKWEPDDVGELRSRIATNVSLLNSVVEGHTRDNVAKLVKHQNRQEDQAILDWLTPADYASQQSDLIRRRQAGTGLWLLKSSEFQTWIARKGETLFCPGIPGSGKTILTSIVVEHIYDTFRDANSIGICYVYFNFQRKDEQRPEDTLASLLKQLAQRQPSVPESLRALYEHHRSARTRPSLEELCKTLRMVAALFSRVFVIVDALDECSTSDGSQGRFLSEILGLQEEVQANILVTSRRIPEISGRFLDKPTLDVRASDDDVARYVDGNVFQLPACVRRNPDLQVDVKKSIVKAVNGMFLLAKLHLDSLKGKPSRKAVRSALANLARGGSDSVAYDSTYSDAMVRIHHQIGEQKTLALQTLAWIVLAKRPMSTTELRHALAVEIGETSFDEENIPDLEDMVSACCGLVTIDEDSDIVRLVHYTTQEFLFRTKSKWFPDAEMEITGTCLTYLSFQDFASGRCLTHQEWNDRLAEFPLYGYASMHWGQHCYNQDDMEPIQSFLQKAQHVQAAAQALQAFLPAGRGRSLLTAQKFTGLHLAAHFGLSAAAVALLDRHAVNLQDSSGRTPLTYAASEGHEAFVKLLLERGAQIELRGKYGRTPLYWAVQKSHVAIVQLLLEAGAEVDSIDRQTGRTPLSWAAGNGHEAIFKLLIDKGASLDSTDRGGQSPLCWAAQSGHAVVVQLLVNSGAGVDLRDKYGRTALSLAICQGHKAVAQILIENGADIEAKDMVSRSLIHWAAQGGHEDCIQLALDNGANVNAMASHGETPIFSAAEQGHNAAVQQLLAKGALGDAQSEQGSTPLHKAAINGCEAVVHTLLDAGASVDTRNNKGRTPLALAATGGHKAVVELLLKKGAQADQRDVDSWTPLFHAALGGNEDVVQVLLGVGANAKALGATGRELLLTINERVVDPDIATCFYQP